MLPSSGGDWYLACLLGICPLAKPMTHSFLARPHLSGMNDSYAWKDVANSGTGLGKLREAKLGHLWDWQVQW